MTELPKDFLKRMEQLLQEEYTDFIASFERSAARGIRLNPLKCGEETLQKAMPFPLIPSIFSKYCYELPTNAEKPGSFPLHHAGAFYSQEPSASSAVTILDPQPGEKILDLCAAPGGKSTQIAGLLSGQGLLWSNEVVRTRASILLSNIERLGVQNAVVSSCYPEVLCEKLQGFFDRVLVDAPCSGEGMFRRDPQAVRDWSVEHVETCAVRQRLILDSACLAVKENGVLVYSTCTFSQEENEGVVRSFLKKHPDFILEDANVSFGRPGIAMPEARRIFPMDGGDGHFVARLRRLSANPGSIPLYSAVKTPVCSEGEALYNELFCAPATPVMVQNKDQLLLLPKEVPQLSGLGVIRAGVLFGELKKGRIEPAHAVWMAAKPHELRQVLLLSSGSADIASFLHGEELEVAPSFKRYTGVAVDGVMTGFGKCSAGRLKNRYPKGLRIHL